MEKLIITAALVGAEVTRKEQPHLPVLPEEIAAEAAAACKAGAAICHVHVRNPDGTPSQDRQLYSRLFRLIRDACDVIVQPSTGGAVGMGLKERMEPLFLQPEMASLTMGTINFGDGVFYNPPDWIEQFAKMMLDRGIKPELEIFDTGMVANALRYHRRGILKDPLHFGFVMGVPGGIPATAKHLLALVEEIPPGSTWSVAAIGRAQLPLSAVAIALGGHVRVGFEDNIYYRKGELAVSNAQLVARIVRLARELERPVATPDEARRILGLS
jgi:3-keto-5-aminohexanoate cleavage enzyme